MNIKNKLWTLVLDLDWIFELFVSFTVYTDSWPGLTWSCSRYSRSLSVLVYRSERSQHSEQH